MTELWGTVTIDDVEVPVFVGTSRDHHVEAWRAIDRALQNKFWMFGAIAASLERTNGGRPLSRDETARLELGECETAIQRFIKSVGIGRQSFQQYNRTYRTFIGTSTTGCTRFMNKLSFKHHEVAARLTDSPEAAVAALSMAHYCRWSANRLEQSLASARPKPKPPVMLSTFFRWLSATIGGWPADTRKHVPAMLRRLCRHVEWSLSPDGDCCPPGIRDLVDAEDDADLPAWVRDLGVPDDTDAIGGHDVEAA